MASTCEDNSQPPIFPIARFCYCGSVRHYYPFGNVPAEDLLENCTRSSLQPSVLILGCGDLRSCFYTLWKNFDFSISNAPKKFNGVHFVMNDYSAAIIARNILFLYLCIYIPSAEEGRKKWLCAMWAIWYCNELYPCHIDLLDSTLKKLIHFSTTIEQWSLRDNPLHEHVRFTSPKYLCEVSDVWKMWVNKTVRVDSVKAMNEVRLRRVKEMTDPVSLGTLRSMQHTQIYGDSDEVARKKVSSSVSEIMSYLQSGKCYAEEVIGVDLPMRDETKINLTLYEREDGLYTCHYCLLPFESYYHTIQFSAESLKSKGLMVSPDFIVPSESFKSKPFLANSVQQFAMWSQSASRVLRNKDISVLFSFDCQDAIAFWQQQMQHNPNLVAGSSCEGAQMYDIISTSNLMDHLSPPNLVLACIPLLKPDGVLVTSSLLSRYYTDSGEELLNACFGFSCKHFPVLLGIRCINNEGIDSTNSVTIKPSLPDVSHLFHGASHVRIFLWTKVPDSQKLTFTQLPSSRGGSITESLVNLVTSSAYALLKYGALSQLYDTVCIETALAAIEKLTSLSDDSTSSYAYWEPLCTALKSTVTPFLHCLQTQMLLHNVHAHLALDEDDCPLCQKTPLNQTLGLFCTDLDLSSCGQITPIFISFVHQHISLDVNDLQTKAEESQDVHIFDSFEVTSSGSILQLKFFAPLFFVEKGYNISIAMVIKTESLNRVAVVFTTTMKSLLTTWIDYSFYKAGEPSKLKLDDANKRFGKVSSHVSNFCKSETKLSFTETALNALGSDKLRTERLSSCEVKFNCGSLNFHLCTCFPVDYGKLKVKISQSAGFMTVSCPRKPYRFEDEHPCFIVNPDHQLSIIPTKISAQMLSKQGQMQFTKKEEHQMKTRQQFHLPPITKLKLFLMEFFQNVSCGSVFFEIHATATYCIIVVNKTLFDYNHRTPAIDLAFSFVDESDKSDLMKSWKSIVRSRVKQVEFEAATFNELKKMFHYFARRTNGTVLSAVKSKYSTLCRRNVAHAFSRAVVYLLLCDPDVKLLSSKPPSSSGSIMTKCACCKNITTRLQKCRKCMSIQYCSQQCQQRHYDKHRKLCDYITKGDYKPRVLIPHVTFLVDFEKNFLLEENTGK